MVGIGVAKVEEEGGAIAAFIEKELNRVVDAGMQL